MTRTSSYSTVVFWLPSATPPVATVASVMVVIITPSPDNVFFKAEQDAASTDGWFDTGDVAVLHPNGTMQITDRSKDVIKSGGEWISSVDLENAAVGCPGVHEAAAIGVHHPKWDERPLLLVVRKPGSAVTPQEIIQHLTQHVAKWWLPDEILFVDDLPHTATGKLLKTVLRDQYKDYKLATAA